MTANVSVSNTTSLYQGSGPVNVLNSTQALYNIFSNSGNVQFSLINANTRISANAINLNDTGVSAGTYGGDTLIPVFTVQADGRITGVVNTPISGALGSYGNSNVAAYLPTYTGSLALSSSIVALTSNAATQQVQIDGLTSNAATQAVSINTLNTNAATQATAINTINANLGAFETYANATFTVSSYGNANVAAYLPTDPTIIGLQSNAATQAVSINTLISNAASQAVAINTLNANLGAFETYANLTFGTSNYANANVAAYLLTNTGNIAAGNFFSDNYLFANGVNILSTIAPSSTYSNANVASYLPTYSGSLENSSSVINLWANAATQSTDIAARALIAGQVFTGNISAPYVIANTAVKGPGSVPDGGAQYAALIKNSATGYDYSWTTDIKAAKVTETVKNTTGSTIAKGTPVYQTGVTGNAPNIAPADASDPNKMPAIGVAGESIAAGAEGFMIVLGNINGVDTSAFATGDAIYVAPGGGYTNIMPQGATDVIQFLGVVTRVNASSGSGFVTGTLTEETFRQLTATGEFQGWTGNAWVTIPGTYSNSNVAAYLPSYSGDLNSVGNITVTGTLFSDDITAAAVLVNGDATITGNLFVEGNVTTINSNVITTNDKTITVANNISSASLLTGAGLEAGSGAIATLLYDYLTASWQSNIGITPTTDNNLALGGPSNRWSAVYAGSLVSPTIDALDANLGTATTNINTLFSNAAAQAGQIAVLDANLGTATTNINTLFSNAATQSIAINSLATGANANVAAYLPTYTGDIGNSTTPAGFGYFQQLTNIQGIAADPLGMTITGSQIFIKTGTTAVEIGDAIQVTPLLVKGNITADSGSYYIGDGSKLTGLDNNSTIQAIDANLGTATTNINTLFSNAATQAGQIQTIDANVGAYETWANTAIGNAYFNGNLRGNTLSDSVLGHVFVNASPYSQPTAVTGGLASYMTTPVVYTSGALQPQNTQTTGLIATSNVGLQATYQTTTNKTAIGHFLNSQWWPVTANTMNNRDRIRGSSINTEIVLAGNVQWNYSGGGASTTTLVSNGTNMILSGNGAAGDAVGGLVFLNVNPVGGSANVRYATGYLTNVGFSAGGTGAMASNIEYARGYTASISTNASHLIQNAIGFHTPVGWAGSGAVVTRRYALLNEDNLSSIASIGNLAITPSSGNVWINTGTSGLIYLEAGTGAGSNLYARANTISFNTNTTGQVNFTGGNVSMTGNTTIGSTGATAVYNGNVQFSGVNNTVNIFGNLVTGTTSSYAVFRGTNLLQGNVNFDAPYYEKVNALGNQSGTLTINTGICNTFTMTLTGDVTLNTTSFTNMVTGKSITLIMTQDGTGNRLLTSDLKYAGGFKTLSTTGGSIDTITVYYDGSRYLATLVSNYT